MKKSLLPPVVRIFDQKIDEFVRGAVLRPRSHDVRIVVIVFADLAENIFAVKRRDLPERLFLPHHRESCPGKFLTQLFQRFFSFSRSTSIVKISSELSGVHAHTLSELWLASADE